MRLFELGGVSIRCNPLTLLLALYVALNGEGGTLALVFASLCLHEACHAGAARCLGYGVRAIELHPFGFAADLDAAHADAWDELIIAAAGPLFSALVWLVCTAALSKNGALGERMQFCANINLGIACVNLLPALPLDGGRILKAALSQSLGHSCAVRIASWAGVGISCVLAALFLLTCARHIPNWTLAVFSIFLLLGALGELKKLTLYSGMSKSEAAAMLNRRGSLPVHSICVKCGASLTDVLKLMGRGRYNVVYVVDNGMRTLYTLSESELMRIVSTSGAGGRLTDKYI